jgi:hypothetical protein
MSTVCAHGVQINFGDLTPYLTYDIMVVALSVAYLNLESAVLHCIPKDLKESTCCKQPIHDFDYLMLVTIEI